MAWPTIPGSGNLTIDGQFLVQSTHSILVGGGSNIASGQNVIAIANTLDAPNSLGGLTGGVLYVLSGSLIYMGATGTITSLAAL